MCLRFVLFFTGLSLPADVGADILDLAETMITSSGLQYEPVSAASSPLFANVLLFSLFLTSVSPCLLFPIDNL